VADDREVSHPGTDVRPQRKQRLAGAVDERQTVKVKIACQIAHPPCWLGTRFLGEL